MDTLKKQQIVKSILHLYDQPYSITPSTEEFCQQKIIDDKNGHYILLITGWEKLTRIYNSLIHIELRDNKIFIQSDFTEEGIASILMEKGIPKEEIVLSYVAPYRRPYMEVNS